MKRVSFEYILENNPARGWVRELLEVKPLRAAASVGNFERALHIACGNGAATDLILKHFSVGKMYGVDRDGEIVAEARRRFGDEDAFFAGDVRSLCFGDGTFDAVFDLGDLHNYADWDAGVRELARVLKSGGYLFAEDLSRESFSHAAGRLFRATTAHPYDEMLTLPAFREAIAAHGFEIVHFRERNPLGLFRYFTAAARKC